MPAPVYKPPGFTSHIVQMKREKDADNLATLGPLHPTLFR